LTSLPDGPPEPASNRIKITSTRSQSRFSFAVAAPLLAAGATLALLLAGTLFFALRDTGGPNGTHPQAANGTTAQGAQPVPTFSINLPPPPVPDKLSPESEAINKEADEMERAEEARDRARALAAREHSDQSPVATGQTADAAPVRLILTVSDPGAAPDRLLALTRRLGGHVGAPLPSPASDLAEAERLRQLAAKHAGDPNSAQPPMPENRTFVAEIPIARADAFRLALRRLGAVGTADGHPAGSKATVAAGQPGDSATGAPVTPLRSVAPAVPTELPAVEPVPGPSVLPRPLPPPTTVTFVVRIEPRDRSQNPVRE